MPFGAAVAVLYGAAGLDQFTVEQARAPQVCRMMGKVTMVKDSRLEETFPREWPARRRNSSRRWAKVRQIRALPQGRPRKSADMERNGIKVPVARGMVVLSTGSLRQYRGTYRGFRSRQC